MSACAGCGVVIPPTGKRGRPRKWCPGCAAERSAPKPQPLVCAGCAVPIPPSRGGRARKWCSEKCRKITLYSRACVDCGGLCNVDGSVKDASERCFRCAKKHRATLGQRKLMSAAVRGRTRWSDEQILAVLRHMARGGRLRGVDFEARYEPGKMPSKPTIVMRFGGWNNALRAAGLATTEPKASGWGITADGVRLALEDCAAELGHLPSAREYEAWAEGGRGPSLAGIRIVCGSWWAAAEMLADHHAEAA